MKLIVAGCRDFTDYQFLKDKLDYLLQNTQEDIEIVSGACRGVDAMAITYAKERGYAIKEFPADWDTHGKSAGFKRNFQMSQYADHLIAFWDGQSKGTGMMIGLAKNYNLRTKIVLIPNLPKST